MGLTFGAVVTDNDVRDSTEGYICKQSPAQMGEENLPNRIKTRA